MSFGETSLWKKLNGDSDAHKRLSSVYLGFREKVAQLTSLIPKTLIDLTIHDISHLDGLWSTASLLIGESYPINPLEIFIFGGAALLHDSALCSEAYDGLDRLRATTVWQDAYALAKERGETRQEELEKYADFYTVRNLHAKQAETLATKTWTNQSSGEHVSLISDDGIRNSFGALIGKIASSHHWNVEELKDQLPPQVNSIAGLPNEWSINPLKIACMLRCADALHIDKSRAPDFLHALTKRAGVSHFHWQAQNWLSQPTILNSDLDESTIVITSAKDFDAENDKAWWIAFELVSLANREIIACNNILTSVSHNNCSPFKIKKIAGVSSPSDFRTYVRTQGWEPSPVELRVSDIKSLVEKLGGQSLYGTNDFRSQLLIVIRELLQNAKDAIYAKAGIEKDSNSEIFIHFEENDSFYRITVKDTGCGMSKRILTGPLLDFGSSFWTSELVNEEFPGLKGSGFKSAGKFGVGFYSSFMVAENVSIMSKRYNESLSHSNQLKFKDGLSLRPMLITDLNRGTMKYSTEV